MKTVFPDITYDHILIFQRQIKSSPSRPNENSTRDNAPESQNFFQSFAPLFGNNSPLGHSRPLLYPEHSFKPAFKTASYRDVPFSGASDNILGSGNFGVVKGGTYYAEERDDADFTSENEPYTYLGSSTHGRVHKKNPPPAFRNGGDFFAHFRDFADITAPSKSYSQYYVVYVNKNATVEDSTRPKQPKNIIEQLTMLDSASEEPLKANESTKQSKFKRKLAAHQSRDSEKEKSIKMKLHDPPKEIAEPLLALS